MKVRLRAVAAVAATLLVGAGMAMSSTASASEVTTHWGHSGHRGGHLSGAVRPDAAAALPTVIAIRGKNNVLYSKYSTSSYFHNLGGVLAGPPAVAYSSTLQQAYYVVVGTDDALYVRSDHTGFTRLVNAKCIYSPTVAISGDKFGAACVGSNGNIYAGQSTLPSNGSNPFFGVLTNQGGKSIGAPTAYYNNSALSLNAYTPPNADGYNVYSRLFSDPAGKFTLRYEICSAPSAIWEDDAIADSTDVSSFYFGCRNGYAKAGPTTAMYFETPHGGNLTGNISGTIGIAGAPDGSLAQYFATSANGAVYSLYGTPTEFSPFALLGGSGKPGVSAAYVDQPAA